MKGKRNIPTVTPTEADKAYAAGFIDGEGCITVNITPNTRNHKSWNPSMYAILTISQVDPRPLQWCQQRWGGSIRKVIRNRSPNERDSWVWCVTARQAQRCFEDVRVMLKVKQEACDNAMRLSTLRKARGSGNALTSEEISMQAEIYSEARRINKARPVWEVLP